jgi:hypothetical protein
VILFGIREENFRCNNERFNLNGNTPSKGEQMPQFIITYFGGDQPTSPKEGKIQREKYMQWLDSIGESAVSPMNPLKITNTINPDGSVTLTSSSEMSGYTIIEAETMDDAIEIAQRCPFLDINGTLEVSELVQLPGY